MARRANSTETLLRQVDTKYPGRNRSSDGWIGDAAHRTRKSDHNPDPDGVVRALDITNDPRVGLSSRKMAENILASRDPRIDYIIADRRIAFSSKQQGVMPWTWKAYGGTNPHDRHWHLSVRRGPHDDPAMWHLDGTPAIGAVGELPAVQPALPADTSRRTRMAKKILDYEARRDSRGNLAVYALPTSDGGGTVEVAGINNKYHPEEFSKLRDLVHASKYAEAEKYATDFYLKYSDVAGQWTKEPGVEFFLRDCVVNRGPKGAAEILQYAVGFGGTDVDGAVGPKTLAAMRLYEPELLIERLRQGREKWENVRDQKKGPRPDMRRGLVIRWNKAREDALAFQKEKAAAGAGTAGAVVVGTGAVIANEATKPTTTWGDVAVYAFIAVVIAASVFLIVRAWKNR